MFPQHSNLDDLTLSLMEHSWGRVRENHGCAGVDGVTVDHFTSQSTAALPELTQQMKGGDYFPLPLRKIVIEKPRLLQATPDASSPAPSVPPKLRTLLVPTVRDRIAQTAVARLLTRGWEETFLTASYAYRPGRGVDLAVAQIIAFRDQGFQWVLDADISAYLDRVPYCPQVTEKVVAARR